MTAQSSNFSRIKQHNAEFPREIFAAKEINRLLTNVDFPAERIWLDLRFDLSMTDPTASSLDVMMISGEAHGIAMLRIQTLYLQQDMETMVTEAIPHELAHILHLLDAKQKDTEIGKQHDEDWQEWLYILAPNATPAAKVKGRFDERPVKLSKGGLAVECECGGEEGVAVVADSTGNAIKLQEEELECSSCKFPYHRLPNDSALPTRIAEDLKFLEGIKCIKKHYPTLQR
ncbi:hypothetical protein IIE18_11230 [Pseudomonas sp. V1]|uniref:hypothetical protein n=1 Tax=Pseudomonas arcuscaelestis TaxID=2710591 RepID=UPI00193EEAFA|nr:hypothetical protein [Pseudomonas arcuscaelestis]MBM3105713.1 hypothetical protein [Pseudomonas arcuscaelestis]